MSEKKNNRRKGLAVALAVVGIAGLSLASASQLTLSTSATLQAGVEDLAKCQGTTPVTVSFGEPTWSGATESFGVTSATFGNIAAACAGLNYKYVILDAGGDTLASDSSTIGGTSVAPTFTSIDAADVEAVALTIYGDNS